MSLKRNFSKTFVSALCQTNLNKSETAETGDLTWLEGQITTINVLNPRKFGCWKIQTEKKIHDCICYASCVESGKSEKDLDFKGTDI